MNITQLLSAQTGLPVDWVETVIAKAPYAYKTYKVAKARGGVREISQPSKETKRLQWCLMGEFFNKFPVHECATAYVKGRGIKHNAFPHRKHRFMAKYDFRDFFTSFKVTHVSSFFEKQTKVSLSESDIRSICRICCKKGRYGRESHLTIGAPTSPILTNILMYEFDAKLQSICKEKNLVYTRYADDITFSTNEPEILFTMERTIRLVLNSSSLKMLRINHQKTLHVSKKYQRRITGVVINNQGQLSIGREKKRKIRSMVHHYLSTDLSNEEIEQLRGYIAFAKDIEPLFVRRLESKYGKKYIDELLHRAIH